MAEMLAIIKKQQNKSVQERLAVETGPLATLSNRVSVSASFSFSNFCSDIKYIYGIQRLELGEI
jgi:hypothetical protein